MDESRKKDMKATGEEFSAVIKDMDINSSLDRLLNKILDELAEATKAYMLVINNFAMLMLAYGKVSDCLDKAQHATRLLLKTNHMGLEYFMDEMVERVNDPKSSLYKSKAVELVAITQQLGAMGDNMSTEERRAKFIESVNSGISDPEERAHILAHIELLSKVTAFLKKLHPDVPEDVATLVVQAMTGAGHTDEKYIPLAVKATLEKLKEQLAAHEAQEADNPGLDIDESKPISENEDLPWV